VALRDVRASDAAQVHALLLGVLEEGLGFVATPSELGADPETSRRALDAVAAGDGVGVVAELGGRVVGYAIARPSGPARLAHDAHLEIVLAPASRGMGLGGALLDALVGRARQDGAILRLSLAVFADNERAVKLYGSREFHVEGHRKGAIREADGTLRDDLLMVLWVGLPEGHP
jgi:ribosomal protein S18 acetylase RimI-like enzyme